MTLLDSQAEIHKLFLDIGRRHVYKKGQVLQSSDDTLKLSLMKSGYVKRYMISNEGSHSIQIIYGADDIYPLTLVYKTLLTQDLYPGPEVFYYETLSVVELYTLDNDQLIEAIENNPALYKDLFSVAGSHIQSMVLSLENSAMHTSYEKVAHLIVIYARKFGVQTSTGIKINVPITHLLLANLLNITRETVSQNIIQLRNKKLIRTNKYFVIPDLELLEKEAYQF